MGKNLAHSFGGGWIDKRLYEIIRRRPASTMTPEEKFYSVIADLGITLTEGGNAIGSDGSADQNQC